MILVLQAGNAVNVFGYGLIIPFEIIYRRQIRGFSRARRVWCSPSPTSLPPQFLGRCISLSRRIVTGGLALGPAIGGGLLASSPDAVWWGGALVAGVIGARFLLASDRILTTRRPRPRQCP